MRQALIVTNPKWERFTAVSDKFKALPGDAILVVRGRVKEKKTGKSGETKIKKQPPESAEALAADLRKKDVSEDQIRKAVAAFKPVQKAAAVVALLLSLCIPAVAQQNLVNKLATSTLAGFTTNSTAGQGFIGWNTDQVAVVQLSAVGTNVATTGTITVLFDTSDNGADWVSAQYISPVVTCNGTNVATGISRITNSVGGKYLRIGGYRSTNANTNAVTVPRFTLSLREL